MCNLHVMCTNAGQPRKWQQVPAASPTFQAQQAQQPVQHQLIARNVVRRAVPLHIVALREPFHQVLQSRAQLSAHMRVGGAVWLAVSPSFSSALQCRVVQLAFKSAPNLAATTQLTMTHSCTTCRARAPRRRGCAPGAPGMPCTYTHHSTSTPHSWQPTFRLRGRLCGKSPFTFFASTNVSNRRAGGSGGMPYFCRC